MDSIMAPLILMIENDEDDRLLTNLRGCTRKGYMPIDSSSWRQFL